LIEVRKFWGEDVRGRISRTRRSSLPILMLFFEHSAIHLFNEVLDWSVSIALKEGTLLLGISRFLAHSAHHAPIVVHFTLQMGGLLMAEVAHIQLIRVLTFIIRHQSV
jgi:hypothetical protein